MSGQHPSLHTPPQAGFERHTTPENIAKFFDPGTYRSHPANPQKRAPPSEASSSHATSSGRSVKPKTMGKDELLDKFKLAAQLNGFTWDDLVVP